uniref:Uncharacterized protein n=1 Tax=Avena sativa TaxID=4498 RepID=A0ACD5WWR9_AVESA
MNDEFVTGPLQLVSDIGSIPHTDLEIPNHRYSTRFLSRRRSELMDGLSPESRAIYDLLMVDSKEEYEKRFLDYKKEVLDAVHPFILDTKSQLKSVNTAVADIKASVEADLEATRSRLGGELSSVRNSLSAEIAQLAVAIERLPRPDPDTLVGRSSAPSHRDVGEEPAGPIGRRYEFINRGTSCADHMTPPVGGMHSGRNSLNFPGHDANSSRGTDSALGPRVELPQFDGSNPKLWQRRCEDYFQRYQMQPTSWASYASDHFVGAAATWLESYLQQHQRPLWTEFVAAVLARFSRNQHQILVRRLIHIKQITTVEDYVSHFSELMDQIAAYESHPDPVHYTTKFLDGLQPGVRILVAIQQPCDLDTAYSLALLYEELGDECAPASAVPVQQFSTHTSSRRAYPSLVSPPPPPPPSRWVSKLVEEKKAAEVQKSAAEDRWQNLKSYRRSKGLCFVCGERWSREHQCKNSIQLHVVQEMIEYM